MNSYDETKKMLNTLRKIQDKYRTSIFENEGTPEIDSNDIGNKKSDITVVNDVEIKINTSDEADLELDDDDKNSISQIIDNFKTQVSMIADFDPGITLEDKQIRFDGTLTDDNISFVFIAGREEGLYINADMLKLEDDSIIVLEKLKKFEETYKTAMDALLDKRNTNI